MTFSATTHPHGQAGAWGGAIECVNREKAQVRAWFGLFGSGGDARLATVSGMENMTLDAIQEALKGKQIELETLKEHWGTAGDCQQARERVLHHWTLLIGIREKNPELMRTFIDEEKAGRMPSTSYFELVATGLFELPEEQVEKVKQDHKQWLEDRWGAWVHGTGPDLYVSVADLVRHGVLVPADPAAWTKKAQPS